MNNLLRTLTESQVRPSTDLRLLLTTVKEGRKLSQDAKLSDPFYDSLEGVLVDLRSVTLDNHDAEAFLKPVSKSDAPDYYDVISTPMDFQTMFKKVKQKAYKSKREFQDDLELIWNNCYTYNATENHPLRQCVNRLRAKSERLLKYITDRKDRADPSIPSSLPSAPPPKVKAKAIKKEKREPGTTGEFGDQTAIVRTGDGMGLFRRMERGEMGGRVRELAGLDDEEEGEEVEEGKVGEKRKLSTPPLQNGTSPHTQPRKRARFDISSAAEEDPDTWWLACRSDYVLGNGLPEIPFPSSSIRAPVKALPPPPPTPPLPPSRGLKMLTTPLFTRAGGYQPFRLPPTPTPPPPLPDIKQLQQSQPKRVRVLPTPSPSTNPKSMLSLMNRNIKTLKRVRGIHARYSSVAHITEDVEGEEGGEDEERVKVVPVDRERLRAVEVEVEVDERAWGDFVNWGSKGKGKGKKAKRGRRGGIELGERNAEECVKWAGMKVLEHAGFQGASASTLDVLSGITTEYFYNVGRTIKFLSDKYGGRMTSEELILHALFESGTSRIQDLERYIWDDVERHGARMGELEKKLSGALREVTVGEVVEDEGLFEEEEEDEAGALAIGDFADMLGEDYLGLRELGIAEEFGMSNLSIPKKLLKRKKAAKVTAAKPTEPPPPFPPPPPFIPLDSSKVEDQIGLLKSYYTERFAALAVVHAPPPPLPQPTTLPGPQIGGIQPLQGQIQINGIVDGAHPPQPQIPTQEVLVLPDDPPAPVQVKMGPLGQIVKPASTGMVKKKGQQQQAPGTPAAAGVPGEGQTPKKKKGTGVGTGNGRKKKVEGDGAEVGAS